MDALKRKMEIAAVAFFCTVTALIAACSCATTAAANLAQQTAAAPATEYVTLAYMEVQPEAEQEPELLYDVPMSDELQRYIREQAERQDVPFEIALAVIERESSYQPDAVSDTGDFGLMQIENDEKLEISGSALLVPRNLTDYQVKVDIALADGKIDSNTHVGGAHGHKFQLFDSRGGGVTGLVGCPLEGDKDKPVGDYHKVESSKESAHIHSLKTFSIESGLLTVYNALKTGESVYLLRFNDGKSYYALERAIV